ncbi:MAG: hypothetical protein ACRENX_05085 [Candidatus Dormibacteria bacterium]
MSSSAIAATLVIASCAAAANGVQHKSAPAILRAAAQALGSARSFEIVATSTAPSGPGTLNFEFEGANEGEGTFTSPSVTFQAEELGGIDYFRSKTLWTQVGGASLQSALGDRWVYISAKSATAAQLTLAFGELTSPKELALSLSKSAPDAVRGKQSNFQGHPVIAVDEPPHGALYVATTGSPYPLRWVQTPTAQVDFTEFGKKFHLRAPKKPLNLAAIISG